MEGAAPAVLVALEHSALGAAVRQSTWVYPLANVVHVVGLAVFAAAVAVLDLRLLGAFAATRPADVVMPARRAAMAAFCVMAASGFLLFAAEASHIAMNPVFQAKAALILLALLNALTLGARAAGAVGHLSGHMRLPGWVRLSALLSLALWLTVAAAGRLIAYV